MQPRKPDDVGRHGIKPAQCPPARWLAALGEPYPVVFGMWLMVIIGVLPVCSFWSQPDELRQRGGLV